jgi:hypothetical protein
MKRFLAPLTVALLLSLVMITVLGGVAFGVIVLPRFQAENMTESSGSIEVRPDPDGTGPAGPHLRWASGAGVAARARQSITVPTGSTVNQIQLFTRQASGGNAVFAIYVDGTALANRVGTFTPPAGSTWAIRTVNLSTAIQPGPHTIYIGPNATFNNNAFIDWFELHGTGSTAAACADGNDNDGDGLVDLNDPGCVDAQDNDETNAPPPAAACADGQDNDGDGLVDLNDPGCAGAQDNDESNAPPPPSSAFNPGVGRAGTTCNQTLQPGGNVETFANSLSAGQTGCLRGGLYTNPNLINLNGSGYKLAGFPGERAEVRGSFEFGSTSNVELEGFKVDGSYAPVKNINGRINTEQSIQFNSSSGAVVDAMEIRNRRTADNSGTCVFGGTSRGARILFSWIHECGDPVALDASGEHGVYIANSTGMLIENSWFDAVSDHCLKYSQAAMNAIGRGVVCDTPDKESSVYFGGTSSGNLVENNVIRGRRTVWQANQYSGSNNRVVDNCLSPSGPVALGSTFTVSGNVVVADPGISGFKVTNLTCAAKLPAGSPFRP